MSGSFLFLPVLGALVEFIGCGGSQGENLDTITGSGCWGAGHLVLSLITVPILSIYVVLAVSFNALVVQRKPDTDSWKSMVNGRADAKLACSHAMLILVYGVAGADKIPGWLAIVMLLLVSVIWIREYIMVQPHTVPWMNSVVAGLGGVFGWATLCVLVALASPGDSVDLLFFFGAVLVLPLMHFLVIRRRMWILTRQPGQLPSDTDMSLWCRVRLQLSTDLRTGAGTAAARHILWAAGGSLFIADAMWSSDGSKGQSVTDLSLTRVLGLIQKGQDLSMLADTQGDSGEHSGRSHVSDFQGPQPSMGDDMAAHSARDATVPQANAADVGPGQGLSFNLSNMPEAGHGASAPKNTRSAPRRRHAGNNVTTLGAAEKAHQMLTGDAGTVSHKTGPAGSVVHATVNEHEYDVSSARTILADELNFIVHKSLQRRCEQNKVGGMLRLLLADIRRWFLDNQFMELMALASATRGNSDWDVHFWAMERLQILRSKRSGNAGEGDLSTWERVLFEQNYEVMIASQRQWYRSLKLLWNALQSKQPDVAALQRIAEDLFDSLSGTEKSFLELLRIHPGSVKVMKAYAVYLQRVRRDAVLAEKYSSKAEKLERAAYARAHREIKHFRMLAMAEGHVALDDSAALVVVNGELSQLGVITECNMVAARLFGRPKSTMIGENVSILIPQPIAGVHHFFLEKYSRTGRGNLMNRTRYLLGIDVTGNLVPLRSTLRESPPLEGSSAPQFSMQMQKLSVNEHFVLMGGTTSGYRLYAADADGYALMGISHSDLAQGDMILSAVHFFPQIDPVYAATWRQQREQLGLSDDAAAVSDISAADAQNLPSTPKDGRSFVRMQVTNSERYPMIQCMLQTIRLPKLTEPIYLMTWKHYGTVQARAVSRSESGASNRQRRSSTDQVKQRPSGNAHLALLDSKHVPRHPSGDASHHRAPAHALSPPANPSVQTGAASPNEQGFAFTGTPKHGPILLKNGASTGVRAVSPAAQRIVTGDMVENTAASGSDRDMRRERTGTMEPVQAATGDQTDSCEGGGPLVEGPRKGTQVELFNLEGGGSVQPPHPLRIQPAQRGGYTRQYSGAGEPPARAATRSQSGLAAINPVTALVLNDTPGKGVEGGRTPGSVMGGGGAGVNGSVLRGSMNGSENSAHTKASTITKHVLQVITAKGQHPSIRKLTWLFWAQLLLWIIYSIVLLTVRSAAVTNVTLFVDALLYSSSRLQHSETAAGLVMEQVLINEGLQVADLTAVHAQLGRETRLLVKASAALLEEHSVFREDLGYSIDEDVVTVTDGKGGSTQLTPYEAASWFTGHLHVIESLPPASVGRTHPSVIAVMNNTQLTETVFPRTTVRLRTAFEDYLVRRNELDYIVSGVGVLSAVIMVGGIALVLARSLSNHRGFVLDAIGTLNLTTVRKLFRSAVHDAAQHLDIISRSDDQQGQSVEAAAAAALGTPRPDADYDEEGPPRGRSESYGGNRAYAKREPPLAQADDTSHVARGVWEIAGGSPSAAHVRQHSRMGGETVLHMAHKAQVSPESKGSASSSASSDRNNMPEESAPPFVPATEGVTDDAADMIGAATLSPVAAGVSDSLEAHDQEEDAEYLDDVNENPLGMGEDTPAAVGGDRGVMQGLQQAGSGRQRSSSGLRRTRRAKRKVQYRNSALVSFAYKQLALLMLPTMLVFGATAGMFFDWGATTTTLLADAERTFAAQVAAAHSAGTHVEILSGLLQLSEQGSVQGVADSSQAHLQLVVEELAQLLRGSDRASLTNRRLPALDPSTRSFHVLSENACGVVSPDYDTSGCVSFDGGLCASAGLQGAMLRYSDAAQAFGRELDSGAVVRGSANATAAAGAVGQPAVFNSIVFPSGSAALARVQLLRSIVNPFALGITSALADAHHQDAISAQQSALVTSQVVVGVMLGAMVLSMLLFIRPRIRRLGERVYATHTLLAAVPPELQVKNTAFLTAHEHIVKTASGAGDLSSVLEETALLSAGLDDTGENRDDI